MQAGTGGDEELESSQMGWNELFQQFISRLFTDERDDKQREARAKVGRAIFVDALTSDAKPLQAILSALDAAIAFVRSKYTGDIGTARLPESKHLSVLSTGLSMYLESALSRPQLDALSAELSAAVAVWLGGFMKLPEEAQGLFCRNADESKVIACRAALQSKFFEFGELGYLALGSASPVIYTTYPISSTIRARLSFPASAVREMKHFSSLEDEVKKDVANGLTPLIVFASIGTGHRDDIVSLRRTCDEFGVWLHVEGEDLGLLLNNPPQSIAAAKQADSFTINPSTWYGLGSTAVCTFFMNGIPTGLPQEEEAMLALALWITMQFVGHELLASIVQQAVTLANDLYDRIARDPSIQLFSIKDSLSVVFRYVPVTTPAQPWTADRSFLNNLNEQLLLDLDELAARLCLDIVNINDNTCLRFRPLNHYALMSISQSHIDEFVAALGTACKCINATLSSAPVFEEDIQRFENLQCVPVRNFVGLGAVRYMPSFFRGHELSDEVRREIDRLNAQLAAQLAQEDSLFSEGRTTDGDICVLIGVETKELTSESAKEYARRIQQMGSRLHIPEKLQDNISEMIKKGIREAEERLKEETEVQQLNQGLIRNLPIVGSIMGWLSPMKVEPQGKAFDICSASLMDVEFSPPSSRRGSLSTATPLGGDGDLPPVEPLPLNFLGSSEDTDSASATTTTAATSSSSSSTVPPSPSTVTAIAAKTPLPQTPTV